MVESRPSVPAADVDGSYGNASAGDELKKGAPGQIDRSKGIPRGQGLLPGQGVPRERGLSPEEGRAPDAEDTVLPGTDGQLHRGAPGQMDPWEVNPWEPVQMDPGDDPWASGENDLYAQHPRAVDEAAEEA